MAPAKKKPPVTGYRQISDKGRPTKSTPQRRSTSAMPGPRPQSPTRTASARPPAESRLRSMEAGPAKVGPSMGQQSTSNSAGPRSARPPAESRLRSMEAGPAKVKAGMGGGSTLSSKPGANAAKAQAGKIAAPAPKPAAKPAAKPSGQFKAPSVPKPGTATKPQGSPQAKAWFEQNKPSARVGKQMSAQQVANINKVRQNLAPAASLLGGARNIAVNAITDVVTPKPLADSTLKAQAPKVAKQIASMKSSASKGAKPTANTSRFAGARDEAMAKAKAIKGSPVVGPKAASAPARMSAPAARSSAPLAPKATAPKASAPKATAPSSPARMSASTYNRVSGNYGTSSTNNPLMANFKDSLPSKAAKPDVGYSPKTKVSSEGIKGAPTDVTKLAFSNPKLSAERTRKIKRG